MANQMGHFYRVIKGILKFACSLQFLVVVAVLTLAYSVLVPIILGKVSYTLNKQTFSFLGADRKQFFCIFLRRTMHQKNSEISPN